MWLMGIFDRFKRKKKAQPGAGYTTYDDAVDRFRNETPSAPLGRRPSTATYTPPPTTTPESYRWNAEPVVGWPGFMSPPVTHTYYTSAQDDSYSYGPDKESTYTPEVVGDFGGDNGSFGGGDFGSSDTSSSTSYDSGNDSSSGFDSSPSE